MSRWEDNIDAPMIPFLDAPDHKPKKTGILDIRGKPIKRPPNPMGFHCPKGLA